VVTKPSTTFAARQHWQLEATGARAVELHEVAIDIGREHRFDHRFVAALGDPRALEVAATGVDRHRHIGWLVGQCGVDHLGIAARQRDRVVAVGTTVLLDLRVAQIGEGHVVELQIAAAGLCQMGNGLSIRRGHVGPERVELRIRRAIDCRAAAAQVQHRRRRDRHLRRPVVLDFRNLKSSTMIGREQPMRPVTVGIGGCSL
jgi:hypothetical protein